MDGLRALPLDQAAARLLSMKRTELQKLAKEAGTKANVKNVDIIASLTKALEQCQQQQQQQNQHQHSPAAAAEPQPAPAAASPSPLAEPAADAVMAAIQSEAVETLEVAACDSAGSEQPQEALAADLSAMLTADEPAADAVPSPATAAAAASPAAAPTPATAAPNMPAPTSAVNASPTKSPAAMLQRPAPTPARQQSADSDLMAEARAMAEEVRTASKRPPLTPARPPGRRSLAASALGNRLRALGSAATPSRAATQGGNAAALLLPLGSPAAAAGTCRNSLGGAASCSLQSFDGSQGRDSVGADAALTAALTSAEPTVSCDLSPGLLTLPGTSAAMSTAAPMAVPAPPAAAAAAMSDGAAGQAAAGWQGATEAQLREMERAWDEYKAGSPGWRAPSPAAVAAKGAALAAAGFTTVQTPLRSLQFAPPPQARTPLSVPRKRAAAGAVAGDENAGVNTPCTGTKMGLPAGKLASASRIPPPTPASNRKGDAAPRATCIPRPSPGNIKGPGRASAPRAASNTAGAPAGKDRAKRAEEAFQARRALAAVRASQK